MDVKLNLSEGVEEKRENENEIEEEADDEGDEDKRENAGEYSEPVNYASRCVTRGFSKSGITAATTSSSSSSHPEIFVPRKLTMPRSAADCEVAARSWVKKYLRFCPGDFLTSRQLMKLCGLQAPRHLNFIVQAILEEFDDVLISRVDKIRRYTNIAVNCLLEEIRIIRL